ncbi:YhdP family protein [Massilia sp. W12]|uniref:YhdP family protein n=1 Tax=Massilia sp. W12 TaxID=3126507 RepID=UPI0030CD14A8
MSNQPEAQQSAPSPARPTPPYARSWLGLLWHTLRASWRYANRSTHHVFGWFVKTVLVLYFLFALLLLGLRYLVLPNIDVYKPDLERLAARALGLPVAIERVYASWSGLHPNLFLGDVVIYDKSGAVALRLPSVSATLSWSSLWHADLRFSTLELARPDLDIRREQDGRIYVAGIHIDQKKSGDGSAADWLLHQREILIHDGRVRWNDVLRNAPELVLQDVHLNLRNEWRRHRAGLRATPPAEYGGMLDIRADFMHHPFARRISDMREWKGVLYADLRATDLAVWQAFVTYPFEIYQGKGSVRAWLDLDHARLARFTADLALEQFSGRLGRQLDRLELKQLTGRVEAREDYDPGKFPQDGQPAFGRYGHVVALQDFMLETQDGLTLQATALEERFQAAHGKEPESIRLQASSLNLQTLAALATRLPIGQAQRRLLHDLAPRGVLHNASLQWRGSYPDISSYRVKARFDNLALAPQVARAAKAAQGGMPAQAAAPAIPGFANLHGSIDASEHGGEIDLDTKNFNLQLPGWLDQGQIDFDQLSLRASWDLRQQHQALLTIDRLQAGFDGIELQASGRHWLPLEAGKGPGRIDMRAQIPRLPLAQIGRYLPQQTEPHLRHWLSHALEAGEARAVSLSLRGDLAHFPFAHGGAYGDHAFLVQGDLHQAKLNYTPGQHAKDGVAPLWPQAEEIQGRFLFDRGRLEVYGDSGKSRGMQLQKVRAVVADLMRHDAVLEIDGTAFGPLQGFIGYVSASPVYEWINHFTSETKTEGTAKLGLKLQLPLHHMIDAKVQGVLQLQNNTIQLWRDTPPLAAVSGRLEFNEKGIKLPGINTFFVGGPLAISGGSQADGAIQIKLSGNASSEGLRRAWSSSALQHLVGQMHGASRYQANIIVRKKQVEVVAESNLQGLTLNLPLPMKKSAAESWPLRVVNQMQIQEDGIARDEIRIQLGTLLQARYQRQRGQDGSWRVMRAGIGVNNPAPESDSGLALAAQVKSLNLDAWRQLAQQIGAGGAEPGGEMEETLFAPYLHAERIALRADELQLFGKRMQQLTLGATLQNGNWLVNVHSPQLSGHLNWDGGGEKRGSRLSARLGSLVIPESAAGEVSEIIEGKKLTRMPALDIVADEFELFNRKLGKLELQANYQSHSAREWQINRLHLQTAEAELLAKGNWQNGRTLLEFGLNVDDAGKMLERFGFANALRNGRGKLSGELQWQGMPYAFDVPSLSGKLKLSLGSGQFLKVEPGAAKLLSVLSLQALPRLLKLDFHDVFSEGFAFDEIKADALIAKGILQTDNLQMKGVNATVQMAGNVDIAAETQNMYVEVQPEINVGTASMVYALAVNPAVGLGSFLAQMFLKTPVSKVFSFHYQVSGSWKEPQVSKTEARTASAPASK